MSSTRMTQITMLRNLALEICDEAIGRYGAGEIPLADVEAATAVKAGARNLWWMECARLSPAGNPWRTGDKMKGKLT
mgnify:CR=1 FL=1